ncbi:NAD(P)H-dependent flavin oxidoreductase [Flavobacterium sp. HTF]|uniref:NAD(P)H-dependent flavin oxidoreductase n=1 Tax=Flavobacterium sp. HTF TaxID=2170732 RepID=UPI000D5EB3B6|nr:nitronate monooxygenase [Flavobacterium sp. HTF]PWB22513.1 2-nitropropane dioxygenase [Flavobacterium sp. HTF]
MWNSTKITQLLGIQYPILLGPMGGSFSTPALLASVSNAGGLGSFGAYTLTPEEILQADKNIKAATTKPYNINLWVNDVDKALMNYPQEKIEQIKQIYKPFFDELGIPLPDLSADIPSKFEKQVDVLFEIKPAVFSFIFGIPSKEILNESRRLGIKTVGAATTLEEALALEEAKVDAIVAAGFEAGGHRPSFLRPAQDSFTGLFSLLQQLKTKIKTPIIAAGGITDAKGIAAALTLGADAVQMGTAFMVTDQSGAHPVHKEAMFSGALNHTTVSKSLTGRMGRMVSNRISEGIPFETEVLPFPLQTKLIAPLRVAALEQNRTDMVSFWSGQNNSSLKHHNADELMQELIMETGSILNR